MFYENGAEVHQTALTALPVSIDLSCPSRNVQSDNSTVEFENPSPNSPKKPFIPRCTPEDRLFERLFTLGLIDEGEEPNRQFPFPSIPPLSIRDGDLNQFIAFLKQKIKIRDENKVWTTNRELWELLKILGEVEGVESTRLLGGKMRTSIPAAWHIKAAKALNQLDTEDLANLLSSLKSLPHHPSDGDIRVYSPQSSEYEFDQFSKRALHFLAEALSEKKSTLQYL